MRNDRFGEWVGEDVLGSVLRRPLDVREGLQERHPSLRGTLGHGRRRRGQRAV